MVDNGLHQEAESLAAAAERLDAMGLNSSLKVRLSLQNAPLARMEYFKVGHPLSKPVHPYSAMVRYRGEGAEEGHVYVRDAGDNYLPMVSPAGDTLSLGAGSHTLLLTRLFSEEFAMVFLRVERTG
jgi:hypothetical protein